MVEHCVIERSKIQDASPQINLSKTLVWTGRCYRTEIENQPAKRQRRQNNLPTHVKPYSTITERFDWGVILKPFIRSFLPWLDML